jgi:hypothetical protein
MTVRLVCSVYVVSVDYTLPTLYQPNTYPLSESSFCGSNTVALMWMASVPLVEWGAYSFLFIIIRGGLNPNYNYSSSRMSAPESREKMLADLLQVLEPSTTVGDILYALSFVNRERARKRGRYKPTGNAIGRPRKELPLPDNSPVTKV